MFHRAFLSIEDFPKNYSCKIFDYPFTIVELTSVIRSLKIRSAPGLDRIDNRMLSLLLDEYLLILLDILNHIFDSGLFPVSWQHSLVFLIPKSSPSKFRPISLTSCLFKRFLRDLFYIIWIGGWNRLASSPPSSLVFERGPHAWIT